MCHDVSFQGRYVSSVVTRLCRVHDTSHCYVSWNATRLLSLHSIYRVTHMTPEIELKVYRTRKGRIRDYAGVVCTGYRKFGANGVDLS